MMKRGRGKLPAIGLLLEVHERLTDPNYEAVRKRCKARRWWYYYRKDGRWAVDLAVAVALLLAAVVGVLGVAR